MAFGVRIAAALSGATPAQLGYWRKSIDRGGNPLLVPEISADRPVLYSFRDVIALRSFVFLRADVSLQKIRRATANLYELGYREHLSKYTVVRTEDGGIALVESDYAIDLVRNPGQQILAAMSDVLAPFFLEQRSVQVPAFFQPRPMLTVDRGIRGGHPVISGTRVPYELVAGLIADGVPPENIGDFYPSVTAEGARDADDFAHYVEEVGRAA